MTNEEIIGRINEIQRNLTFKGYNTPEEKKDWWDFQKLLNAQGLKIGKRHENGLCVWRIKNIKPTSERNFRCGFKKVDLSPDHDHLKGNCTTRALSYIIGGEMTYDEIEAEQYALADKINREHELSGRKRVHRNTSFVWVKVLEKRGYVELRLNSQCPLDKLAYDLRSITVPIAVTSRNHATVIHNENGIPCVVDKWDCRGIRKIKRIIADEDTAAEIRDILYPNAYYAA